MCIVEDSETEYAIPNTAVSISFVIGAYWPNRDKLNEQCIRNIAASRSHIRSRKRQYGLRCFASPSIAKNVNTLKPSAQQLTDIPI